MKINSIFLIFILAIITFTACDDDDPTPENQEELITTLRLTFTDKSDQSTYELQFRDLDGDGGNPPVITGDKLPSDTQFDVELEFLNESVNPAEDITDEIRLEAEEHQVFFIITGVNLTQSYEDEDVNGKPLGIVNTLNSGGVSSGTLRVVLRHMLNKDAQGVSEGDITNAGGETDIDVLFEVEVE